MFDFAKACQHMVESQIRTSDVTDINLLRAFRTTPRELFVPVSQKSLAYSEHEIKLDDDRTMMSPRNMAKMIHAAEVTADDIVLDVACGRGYSTAILAKLADTVVGLEDDSQRVEKATANLMDIDVTNAAIVEGPIKAGAAEHGPFNVIFVNGAVAEVPQTWLDQLAHHGRLVVVKQDGPMGKACVYTRSGNTIGEKIVFDASIPALEEFKRQSAFAL